MKKERIIKQQARQALKGNLTALIVCLLAAAVVAVLLDNILYIFAIPLGIVDANASKVTDGMELWYTLMSSGVSVLAIIASPLLNGFLKAAAKTAANGKCTAADALYYYRKPLRFFKTLVVNLGLALLFAVLSAPLDYLVSVLGAEGEWTSVLMTAGTVVWKILLYIFLLHYPLAAYALDGSRSPFYYIFGLIGFSFRRCGALIKLLLSMLGWIALCFFVVPAFYVVPYLAVAAMTSAKWLFAIRR